MMTTIPKLYDYFPTWMPADCLTKLQDLDRMVSDPQSPIREWLESQAIMEKLEANRVAGSAYVPGIDSMFNQQLSMDGAIKDLHRTVNLLIDSHNQMSIQLSQLVSENQELRQRLINIESHNGDKS